MVVVAHANTFLFDSIGGKNLLNAAVVQFGMSIAELKILDSL